MPKAYTPKQGAYKGQTFRSYYAYRVKALGYNATERRKMTAAGHSSKRVAEFQKAKADLRNQKSKEARLRMYVDFLDEFEDFDDGSDSWAFYHH